MALRSVGLLNAVVTVGLLTLAPREVTPTLHTVEPAYGEDGVRARRPDRTGSAAQDMVVVQEPVLRLDNVAEVQAHEAVVDTRSSVAVLHDIRAVVLHFGIRCRNRPRVDQIQDATRGYPEARSAVRGSPVLLDAHGRHKEHRGNQEVAVSAKLAVGLNMVTVAVLEILARSGS